MNAAQARTRILMHYLPGDLVALASGELTASASAERVREALRHGILSHAEEVAACRALWLWEHADDAACIALERVENYVEEEA